MDNRQKAEELLLLRNQARKAKNYTESDRLRTEIEQLGYKVEDTEDASVLVNAAQEKVNVITKIALFGSGESSPTGRRIHEELVKDLPTPVSIALLMTPAGFEVNPYNWYKKLAAMLEVGLYNYKPQIKLVEAFHNTGKKSVNNESILSSLLSASYIHAGAGSPTYAARILDNSKAYEFISQRVESGVRLSLASAAAIAFSKYVLPVYEIYKAGEDLHWKKGLNFFSRYELDISIIPHFNNTEGGVDIDTSFCYMGRDRFHELRKLVPTEHAFIGIDEQTVCIFEPNNQQWSVSGTGGVHILKGQGANTYINGQSFHSDVLR